MSGRERELPVTQASGSNGEDRRGRRDDPEYWNSKTVKGEEAMAGRYQTINVGHLGPVCSIELNKPPLNILDIAMME